MTLVTILIAVVVLGGAAVAVRIWTEQQARQLAATRAAELEVRVEELQRALTAAGEHEREWLAVLAHELRTPVGAVLGYAELIGDGALGSIDPRVTDAVARMGSAANHILSLVQGLEDLARLNETEADEPRDVPAAQLLADAADIFSFEAEARGASIEVVDSELLLHTRQDDLRRGLLLALGAAVKVSAGRTLQLSARMADAARAEITIAGTALRGSADDPARQPRGADLTGAGFRIALARSSLAHADASLELQELDQVTSIVITVPALHAS
jgi:two-component system, NtrC family, sensor kinase